MKYIAPAIIAVILLLAGTGWWMVSNVNKTGGPSQDNVRFTVASGAKLRAVAVELEEQKFIPSASAWVLYAITQGQRSNILAGVYDINQSMTGREILRTLTTNPMKDNEVTVIIPEGLTNKEIAALLEKKDVISAADFLAAAGVHDSRTIVDKKYDFMVDKSTAVDLEGYLFPDTYRFYRRSSAATVIQKFLDNFDAKVGPELRQAAKDKGRTLFDELIIASIVEVELLTDTDRAIAADLFWRRDDAGMGLNSDATVNYALGIKKDRLSNSETSVDSPYNTYKYRGLPPGPINNPGISAIRAAINPTSNQYWYYLTAPGGKTIWAKTLEEQTQHKQQYLQ